MPAKDEGDASDGQGDWPWNWCARGTAAAALVYVLLASPIREEVALSFAPGSYQEKRVERVFRGIDVDGLRARLDALLPRDVPVGLATTLSDDPFLLQRLTEGVYPRRVDPNAEHIIDSSAIGAFPPWRVLATVGPAQLVLSGKFDGPEPAPPVVPAPPVIPAPQGLASSLLRTALALIGLVGLGLSVARRLLGASAGPAEVVPAALLSGGLLVCWLWSLASWLGLSLPIGWLTAAGCVGAAWSARRFPGIAAVRARARVALSQPWTWCLAAVLLLLAARLAAAPIGLWDGRSIWLFQARRIWEHGALLASEARGAASVFHADYPLFFPSWLAFSAGPGSAFDERAAALGIALLCAATLWPCAALAREALGRFTGPTLVVVLYVGLDCSLVGGYADGLLTFLLLLEFLALASERRALGLLAAAAATLIKLEGVPLAFLVLCVAGLLRKGTPRGPWARGLSLLLFVPALVHLCWTRHLGLDSLLKGGEAGAALAGLVPRIGIQLEELPTLFREEGYTSVRSLLVPGTVAVLATPLLLLARAGRERRRASAAWLLSLLMVAFALVSIAALPEDARWFVLTALDRLLVHAVALALVALLAALAPGPARAPAPRGAGESYVPMP